MYNSVDILKTTKLYILKGLILWNANYTSLKMFKSRYGKSYARLSKMKVPNIQAILECYYAWKYLVCARYCRNDGEFKNLISAFEELTV